MDEHFEWIAQGLEDSELQQCVGGVLSSLQAKPKNLGVRSTLLTRASEILATLVPQWVLVLSCRLQEDFGRVHAEFNDCTHNYERRNKLIQFLSDGITLDALRQFVATTLTDARRLYLQVCLNQLHEAVNSQFAGPQTDRSARQGADRRRT